MTSKVFFFLSEDKHLFVYLMGITGFLKPKWAVNMNPSTAMNRNWQKVMVFTQLGTSLKLKIKVKKIDSIKYKVFLFPYNHLSKHNSCQLTSSPSAQDKSSDTPLPTPSLQTPNSLHWHNSHVLKPTSHPITLQLPWVTKTRLFLVVSIKYQAHKKWKNINKGIISLFNTKFSELTLQELYGRQ